ncbi:hypothetical protein BC834DRAFT_974195 [Gloeopeniophorella convolvens]|nr:hypothetical protein BC834DRAFT_974195 [Gloeopeniophorella convolvens]
MQKLREVTEERDNAHASVMQARSAKSNVHQDLDDAQDEVERLHGELEEARHWRSRSCSRSYSTRSPRRHKVRRTDSPDSTLMVLSGAEYEDLYGGPSSLSHHAPVVAMPPSNPVPVANPQDDAMPILDPATFMVADSDPDSPTVGSLLGRLAEPPIPGLQARMTTAPPMTSAVPILCRLTPMSLFIQIAKIYCLLLCFWYGAGNELLFANRSAPENNDGTIDVSCFSHAVLVMPRTGEPDERGVRCTTTLVPMEQIVGGNSHINRALRLPLALGALPPGGKDGVLIAPNDPSTSAEVDKLFQRACHDSAARARLHNYIKRVQFTPPEIRQDPHHDVPARWQTFEYSNETELAPPNELGPRC